LVRRHRHRRVRVMRGNGRAPRWKENQDRRETGAKHSSGGARVGHASLMRPDRPLPTLPFANLPLRLSPKRCRGGHRGLHNPGAWHLLGLTCASLGMSWSAHTLNLGERRRHCQWAQGCKRCTVSSGNIRGARALRKVNIIFGGPIPMGRSEEYRRFAAECLEMASAFDNPQARAVLLQMAQVWFRLSSEMAGCGDASEKGTCSE
jgi:hypothetical protein